MNHVISADALASFTVGPAGSHARVFNGAAHELPSVSLMLASIEPGEGATWHRHTYDEVFVIHEGQVTFTIGEEVMEAAPGKIVLIPAGVPHSFTNTGTGVLKQTAVHAAPKVEIEWLDV